MIVRIRNKLREAGITAHLPQKSDGHCEAPYAVILDQGQRGEGSRLVGNREVEILLYVPKNRYVELEELKDAVKDALKDEVYLKRTGQEQPVVFLSSTGAYMSSIGYRISKIL